MQDIKIGDLETVINILEYRAIPIEKCKIVVQRVKIPAGKGRLYLMNDTVSRKRSIVTVKNDDTTCLARSIVTAMANLHSEKWTIKLNSKMDLTNRENFKRNKHLNYMKKLRSKSTIMVTICLT